MDTAMMSEYEGFDYDGVSGCPFPDDWRGRIGAGLVLADTLTQL
jgi:hypothetical protein